MFEANITSIDFCALKTWMKIDLKSSNNLNMKIRTHVYHSSTNILNNYVAIPEAKLSLVRISIYFNKRMLASNGCKAIKLRLFETMNENDYYGKLKSWETKVKQTQD